MVMGIRIKKEYGNWFRGWNWDWWVTLTFNGIVYPKQAHRLWTQWIHALEKTVMGKIHYIRVMEKQRLNYNNPHFHALLMGVKDEDPCRWEDEWYRIAGEAKIEKYNGEGGAAYYLAKDAYSGLDIKFSKDLEKLRRPATYLN